MSDAKKAAICNIQGITYTQLGKPGTIQESNQA